MTCGAEGCDRPRRARGFCTMHYQRLRAAGELAARSPEQRFWARVEVGHASGCWVWTGSVAGAGYGIISVGHKNRYVHRFAYELLVGRIPAEMEIDHLCRNRRCVNVNHLDVVTHTENVRRSKGISVINGAKTHCPSGHPYDERNTSTYRGWRRCRECDRLRHRRARGLLD